MESCLVLLSHLICTTNLGYVLVSLIRQKSKKENPNIRASTVMDGIKINVEALSSTVIIIH